MKRQLILFAFAAPLCLIAGTLHWTATTSRPQTWNLLLSVFRLLAGLPEAGALLCAGLCCFLLAWLLHRRRVGVHAR